MAIKTCVSLYSLQFAYVKHEMNLRDIMAALRDNGIEGFELLPDQMIHGAPNPSSETLREWDRLREDFPELTPVCDDIFLNTNLYNNRSLTKRECIDLLVQEMEQAHRLGFTLMRFVPMIPGWVIEPLLPHAERLGIDFGIEIHAGMSFNIPEIKGWIDEMIRLDSPHCGLVIDTGIFCKRVPRVFKEYHQKLFGVSQEVVDFIDDVFVRGLDATHCFTPWPEHEMIPELARIASEKDEPYFVVSLAIENNPLSILDPYWKYIKHFRFKVLEMTDEGEEYSIDYKKIIQHLHDHGYSGYVSTEYEGQRSVLPGEPYRELEQVLAHQAMVKRYLKEIQG